MNSKDHKIGTLIFVLEDLWGDEIRIKISKSGYNSFNTKRSKIYKVPFGVDKGRIDLFDVTIGWDDCFIIDK